MAFHISPFLSIWHGEARTQVESHNHISLRSSEFGVAREDEKEEKSQKQLSHRKGIKKSSWIYWWILSTTRGGNNSNLIQTPSEKREENTSQPV